MDCLVYLVISMNFMNFGNPFSDYLNMCCGKMSQMDQNPMMHCYKHMMDFCMKNCSSMNSSFDMNSCNANGFNLGSNNNCYKDAFSLYPMMMKNFINLMEQVSKCSSQCAKSSCDKNSCDTKSGECTTSFCDIKSFYKDCDMKKCIQNLECCSNTWAENFGKLHGKMMEFNEQAMQYIQLINENITTMKDKMSSNDESRAAK